jgi:hypothetical protein
MQDDELFTIWKWKRAKQQPIDNRKDGSIGADSQSQSEHDSYGKDRRSGKSSKAVSDVHSHRNSSSAL